MSSIEQLQKRVNELTSKGLTTDEIARQLNIQRDTVVWLSTHKAVAKSVEKGALDIYINLSSIQSSTHRLRLLSGIFTHFISQDIRENRIGEPDVVVGIELTGIPLATMVAENLGKPLTIMRHAARGEKEAESESWIINPAFSDPAGRKAVLIDDVITGGFTVTQVIRSLRQNRTEVEAVYVIFDKKGSERIEGVSIRPLVTVLPLKTG